MSKPQGPDSAEVLELFNQHLSLVDVVARQVGRSTGANLELDDLQSFARQGLLDAARRFEPSRGIPFAGYARLRMRGAVIDGLRAQASLPRRVHERLRAVAASNLYSEGLAEDVLAGPRAAVAADAEQALSDHLAGMATAMALGLVARTALQDGEREAISAGSDPESLIAEVELAQRLREAIAELPVQEATMVRRHYLEGERFDQVAAAMGLSKSWGSRLHSRALLRLSKRLRGVQD